MILYVTCIFHHSQTMDLHQYLSYVHPQSSIIATSPLKKNIVYFQIIERLCQNLIGDHNQSSTRSVTPHFP
jgi:hypothetical protein